MRLTSARTVLPWAIAISAGLMVVGAVAPWMRTPLVVRTGTDDPNGWVVILAAASAGALLGVSQTRGLRWPLLLSAFGGLLGVIVFFVAADDVLWSEPLNLVADGDYVDGGWGLFLVLVGSAGVLVSSLALYAGSRSQPRPSVGDGRSDEPSS